MPNPSAKRLKLKANVEDQFIFPHMKYPVCRNLMCGRSTIITCNGFGAMVEQALVFDVDGVGS